MRPVREITAEEENFRVLYPVNQPQVGVIRRDPVKPEPEGTVILMAFIIKGYDQDRDGSLMARLEQIGHCGIPSGLTLDRHGLYPDYHIVVSMEEWDAMFDGDKK